MEDSNRASNVPAPKQDWKPDAEFTRQCAVGKVDGGSGHMWPRTIGAKKAKIPLRSRQ